jgi:hypothetical protein
MDGGLNFMTPVAARKISRQRITDANFPYLIKITHPEYAPMLYVNAPQDVRYADENYTAASFSIQPPDRDGSKIGDATLTISAVDQVWPEKIRGTQVPARIQFIAVILYEENGSFAGIEALEENSFTLRGATWNETTVTWRMVFDENMSIMVPAEKCNAMTCPGCA